MKHQQRLDQPNPNAPAELSRFAFLIGQWRFDARFKSANARVAGLSRNLLGYYILDGYAIADEYNR